MKSHNKITQRHPQNGSQPSEQTAQQANQKVESSKHGSTSDEMIFNLVENTVQFAQEQFETNLSFNNEVLTNVLYDNIYKILQENIESSDFAKWLADELIKQGCVFIKSSEDGEKTPIENQISDSQSSTPGGLHQFHCCSFAYAKSQCIEIVFQCG